MRNDNSRRLINIACAAKLVGGGNPVADTREHYL